MKKLLQTLFAVAVAFVLLPGCDALQTDYSDVKARVDVLEGTTIPSVEQQVTAIKGTVTQLEEFKATLDDRVKALESDDDANKKDIADLKATVEDLEKQISELKTLYIDVLDDATRSWAEETFLTITKAQELSDRIKAIEDLDMGAYKTQIQSQVDAIEASLKAWVNTQLADYATISDVTSKIDQLKADAATANGELKTELEGKIATLQTEFTDAKSYFETSLKEAIEKACAANGLIDAEIAKQINDAKTTLQGKIDTLEDSIEALENRITALEQTIKDMLARIQSIKVVPTYTDGYVDAPGAVKFDIQPLEAAKALAETEGAKDFLNFQAVEVATKAESSFKNFTVKSVKMDPLGEFVLVTVAIPEDASWKEAFEAGTLSLSARLCIEAFKGSGNYVSKTSDYFTLYYNIPVTSITLDKTEASLGIPVTLTATVEPSDATDKTIVWSSSDETVATVDENGVVVGGSDGTAIITATPRSGSGISATCTVNVEKACVQLWEDGPYWATYNVGATKAEEYGYYFQWGDVTPYTYKYDPAYPDDTSKGQWVKVEDGSSIDFAGSGKNCPTFNKKPSVLLSEGYIDDSGNLAAAYDAATAYLGSSWRMPTRDEIFALKGEGAEAKCTNEWTDDYKGTGVAGMVVKGKGEYASRSIFLPAAGRGQSSKYYYFAKTYGYYRSSTPTQKLNIVGNTMYVNNASAAMYFISGIVCTPAVDASRYDARSVRPVYVP